MATATGTNVKFVKVQTKQQYTDYTEKDGALIFVENERKIYVDGIPYGFNSSDVHGELIRDLIEADNVGNSVQLSMYWDEENTQRVMFEGNVKIIDDSQNLIRKEEDGGLIVVKDDVTQLVDDYVSHQVLDKRGQKNGFATLDGAGKVPTLQLPSYVDDIVEYSAKASFPEEGETGKLYIDLSNNKVWRWSGSTYVNVSDGNAHLTLGTTASTAYRGDYGNTAYTHSQLKGTDDNPHSITKRNVGLGNVENFPVATEEQAWAGNSDSAYMTPRMTYEAISRMSPKLTWTVVS